MQLCCFFYGVVVIKPKTSSLPGDQAYSCKQFSHVNNACWPSSRTVVFGYLPSQSSKIVFSHTHISYQWILPFLCVNQKQKLQKERRRAYFLFVVIFGLLFGCILIVPCLALIYASDRHVSLSCAFGVDRFGIVQSSNASPNSSRLTFSQRQPGRWVRLFTACCFSCCHMKQAVMT